MVKRKTSNTRNGHFALYALWDQRRCAPAKVESEIKNLVYVLQKSMLDNLWPAVMPIPVVYTSRTTEIYLKAY